MTITFSKYTLLICFITLLNACGKSYANEAIPGVFYPHKTEEKLVILNSRESFKVYATYNWSICDKDVFIKELKYFYIDTLEPRIELRLINTIRLVAANIQNADIFFSDKTLNKIKIETSSTLSKKGLCIENLKIYPYNKSLQPTADAPAEFNR